MSTIVGAGLAGCLLACFLARRGLHVTLYERRGDPSGRRQVERGRSINLAISERGLDALRRIGLEATVMADAIPMRGRMIHPVDGELDFQPYSADGAAGDQLDQPRRPQQRAARRCRGRTRRDGRVRPPAGRRSIRLRAT